MPDFGPRWIEPELLVPGGQALTYKVKDADRSTICVAKILNNHRDKRRERFLNEIAVTESFDHPNVVRSLGRGETKSKFPYFVMPYYAGGTLEENYKNIGNPIEKLRVFRSICEGVAYAHSKGLIHRDLKPANIFIDDKNVPIVGDFGLCYRFEESQEERNTQIWEAVGARKYMPPEWREGRFENPEPSGDIYSLGKILFWLFKGRVYDGHEDDHSEEDPIVKTLNILTNGPEAPQGWTIASSLASELVGLTVRKKREDRLANVSLLIERVSAAIERIESGGRVLDLNLPKRCLFCGEGTYQRPASLTFIPKDMRVNPTIEKNERTFQNLRHIFRTELGFGTDDRKHIPLYLVCDICGNIQYFRLDLTKDKSGQKWNP